MRLLALTDDAYALLKTLLEFHSDDESGAYYSQESYDALARSADAAADLGVTRAVALATVADVYMSPGGPAHETAPGWTWGGLSVAPTAGDVDGARRDLLAALASAGVIPA